MVLLGGVGDEISKLLIVDAVLQLLKLTLMMIYSEKEQAEEEKIFKEKNHQKMQQS